MSNIKEITILSGKGGTGKTSITAAFASISSNAVFCDSDVDAADLFLILDPEIIEEHRFESGFYAEIDPEKCSSCGLCYELCRFNAIHFANDIYKINPYQCEGCRLCERKCPENAISSFIVDNNLWFVSNTRFGILVHARMAAGEENSGKLVTTVRKRAKEIAEISSAGFVITDGPPGIGCPVIASLTGTDVVVVVAEPTNSGLHDIRRLISLIKKFDLKIFALINKSDINEEISRKAEAELRKNDVVLLGKIPFNENFVKAMLNKQSFIEFAPDHKISKDLIKMWNKIIS